MLGQWFTLLLSTHRQTDVWFVMHHQAATKEAVAAENDLPWNHYTLQTSSIINHTRVIKALQTNVQALEDEISIRDQNTAKEKRELARRNNQIERQVSRVTQELEADLEESKIQQQRSYPRIGSSVGGSQITTKLYLCQLHRGIPMRWTVERKCRGR